MGKISKVTRFTFCSAFLAALSLLTAGGLIAQEIRPIAERPFSTHEWPAQLDEVIERRVKIFEGIMPYKIAAELHRHQSPFLADHAAELTREQRAALDRIVPKNLRKDAQFMDSLELVLSFESWRRLRKDQKLTVLRARRVIAHLVRALLNAK